MPYLSTSRHQSAAAYRDRLGTLLSSCDTILIDTCSILEEDSFINCMRRLLSRLKPGQVIIIPHMVLKELHYHAHSGNSPCQAVACRMEHDISALAQAGAVKFVGEPNVCEHTDHYILRYTATHCFQVRLLIITQDKALTSDLLALSHVTSKVGAPVLVRNLDNYGNLVIKYEHPSNVGSNLGLKSILKKYGI